MKRKLAAFGALLTMLASWSAVAAHAEVPRTSQTAYEEVDDRDQAVALSASQGLRSVQAPQQLPTVQGVRSVSPACAGGLVFDDGDFEAGYAPGPGPNTGMVMRFDPPAGTSALDQVCACWFSGDPSDATIQHTIVVYDDDGPGGAPGTLISSIPTSAAGVPHGSSAFYEYNFTAIGGLPVPPGSFYVGIGGWDTEEDDVIFLCVDQTPGESQPGYLTLDGGASWLQMGAPEFVPDYRNLSIRADLAEGGACTPDDTTLCLTGDRFQVKLTWRRPPSQGGNLEDGRTVLVGSEDSGLFYFQNPDNWELLIKVRNACTLNNRFWVFFAATTNVEYTVTVTDTATGAVKQYSTEAGPPSPAITDTDAFATCP